MRRRGGQAAARRFAIGIATAALVLALDQVSKLLILGNLELGHPVRVTGFFNLALVWNRGVSFGMFNNGGAFNSIAFSLLAGIIIVALLVWLWRSAAGIVIPAIGLIVGGALGNVVDRLRLGAVVDFLDFHLGTWHYAAFNLADSAICVGVALLLIDGLLRRRDPGK